MTNEYENEQETEQTATPIDVDAVKATLKRNAPLAGDYVTDPESFGEMTVTREVNGEDDDRVSFQIAGRARSARRGKEETVNFLRYRISAETRPAKNFETGEEIEGKDDLRSRLFAQAFAVYEKVNDGGVAKTVEELAEFLAVTPGVVLNTMASDDGNLIVLRVKAPRG